MNNHNKKQGGKTERTVLTTVEEGKEDEILREDFRELSQQNDDDNLLEFKADVSEHDN